MEALSLTFRRRGEQPGLVRLMLGARNLLHSAQRLFVAFNQKSFADLHTVGRRNDLRANAPAGIFHIPIEFIFIYLQFTALAEKGAKSRDDLIVQMILSSTKLRVG